MRQLPFTEVKIDQAFVADVDRSRDCRLIVKAITDLAHGLGLTATAEGVETIEQLRLVRELGCDLVQGYLISPPLEPRRAQGWQQEFRAQLAGDARRRDGWLYGATSKRMPWASGRSEP